MFALLLYVLLDSPSEFRSHQDKSAVSRETENRETVEPYSLGPKLDPEHLADSEVTREDGQHGERRRHEAPSLDS